MQLKPEDLTSIWVAALDESNDERIYCAGGIVARLDSWAQLQWEWNAIISRDTRLSHWHQSDAWARRNPPWSALTRAECDTLSRDLASAIAGMHGARGVSVTIDRAVWNAAAPKGFKVDASWFHKHKRDHQEFLNSPYSVICPLLGHRVMGWFDNLDPARKALCFIAMEGDREHPGKESQIGENFRFWIDEWRKKGSTRRVMFGLPAGKDGQLRPLEAADLYLWALRRFIADKKRANPLWDLMQKSVPARDTLISHSAIANWFAGMPKSPQDQDTR